GLGWNEVEYEALGMAFRNKNRRIEEQIALLRKLWTESVVDFTGRWHRVDRAALNPRPVQRPIPIWMGGSAEDALRRIARIADGWFAQHVPNENGLATFDRFRGYLKDAGRDPDCFPIEGRISVSRLGGGPDEWVTMAQRFRDDLRCTHLEINTMGAGYATLADHVAALEPVKDVNPMKRPFGAHASSITPPPAMIAVGAPSRTRTIAKTPCCDAVTLPRNTMWMAAYAPSLAPVSPLVCVTPRTSEDICARGSAMIFAIVVTSRASPPLATIASAWPSRARSPFRNVPLV